MKHIDFDKEYNVNGSGSEFQEPKTEVYFLNVPFGKDYKHVVDFPTHKARMDALTALSDKHVTAVNIVRKDTEIVIDGVLQNMERYNYVMYKNASLSNKWWYAFITGIDYQADHLTKVKIKTDVWQSYLYERKIYKSLVERTHIPVNEDSIGRWVMPEPFYSEPEESREVDTVLGSSDWEPQWVLHTTSKYNNSTDSYEYSGTGSAGTYSGEYGHYVNSPAAMKDVMDNYGRKSFNDVVNDVGIEIDWKQFWKNLLTTGSDLKPTNQSIALTGLTTLAELQDHRDECVGLYAIPRWAIIQGQATPTNDFTYRSDTLQLDRSTLASGYRPRNKKLLSSVFTQYILYNRNGFKVSLNPEMLGNTLDITVGCSPMGTTGYIVSLDNYENDTNNYFKVPYSCSARVGYDANTGLDKAVSGVSSLLGLTMGIGRVTSGDASSIPGILQSGEDLIDFTKPQYQSIGSSGDITSVTDGRATIRLAELSPSAAHSRAADRYLDQFGYAVNEILNVSYYIKSRSNWNYIKTQNVNLSIKGPADDCEELKDIFNSGTTIWHGLDHFGDYDQTNS